MVQKFTPQKFSNVVSAHAYSDFAGCLLTRKSTIGMLLWASRPTSLEQPTARSQSLIRRKRVLCLGKGSGFRNGNPGAGIKVNLQVYTDSAAALGTWNRLGLGKSRHIQTRFLWIQEKLAERSFELIKIDTKLNAADICTKALASEAAERHLRAMGFEEVQGRSSIANAAV